MTRKHPKSVLSLFRHVCQNFSENIAAEDGPQTVTYRDLDAKSSFLAHRLQQAGAKPGQVIPILTNSCIHMIIGVLAILKTGGVYVPIDRDQWPQDRIDNVLKRTKSDLIVYTGEEINAAAAVSINAEDADLVPTGWEDPAPIDGGRSELASIIFTSGTTNEPKGVMIKHKSLVHFVSSPSFNYDVTPEDRVLLVLSVAFDACMGTLFNTICNGGTVVLANGLNFQERTHRCSVLVATPSILEALEPPHSAHDYHRLDRIVLGGETPSKKLLEAWSVLNRPIWIAYGPTEATCATLTGLIATSNSTGEFQPTVLGSSIDGAEVSIVDEDMNAVDGLDEAGELLISGPGLAEGYWRDERQTNEKFFMHNGKRTYRTGDLAKWSLTEQGKKVIDFCGRRDRVVKIRGFLVNLDLDVDAGILMVDPSVKAVFSLLIGKKLCTAVAPASVDTASLKCRWRAKATPYFVPDHLFGLASLPITPNGKVDPRKLARVLESMLPNAEDAPEKSTELRDVVIGGMSRILDIPISSIDVEKSFVNQGLHSLAGAMLSSHCRRHGFPVSVQELLTATSIESLIENCQGIADVVLKSSIGRDDPSRAVSVGPLTSLQKKLIYGSHRNKAVNIVQHIAPHHSEDIPLLRAAWEVVASVEPIFQTVFEMDELVQTQRLTGQAAFLWDEIEVYSHEEAQLGIIKAADTVGLGSSFRVLHCKGPELPENESILVWTIHHALIDGFSASLILNKVAAALDGRQFDISPPFPLAAEDLQKLSDQMALEADMFWRQQEKLFPGASGELLIPKPDPAPNEVSYAEHGVQTDLDIALLASHAQNIGITPAAMHYATWALLMSSYTNSDTVVFGAVLSGRNLPFEWTHCVVGPLINTQPLRLKIDRVASSSAFLKETHNSIQSLSKFQATESKQDSLSFSSALAVQYDAPKLDSTTVKPLCPPIVKESTDLPLNILIEEDGRVRILYRSDLFSATDVENIGSMYRNLLHSLTQPGLSIQQCLDGKLSPSIVRDLLAKGHHGSPGTYVVESQRTVTGLFEEAAIANAANVAVEKGSESLTYEELSIASSRVARIVELLVAPGDVVCVQADRSINWIVGVFACLKAGAVYCPLDVSHSVDYRAELLRSSGAKLLLCTESGQMQEPMTGGPVALAIDQILSSNVVPKDCASRGQDSRAVAFMCFTSGSTGKPKGVMCEHGGIVAFHESLDVRLHSRPGLRIAQFMSPGFDACVHEIFASLCYGATLVLRKDPHNPCSHLPDVDVAMLTPSIAAGLEPSEYQNLKYLYFAGEPVPQKAVERWAPGRMLYNLYGPTEGTIGACQQRLQAGVPVNVGPPVQSMRLYILNDRLELQPPGAIGDIFIAGVQVSRGYVNMEAQTAREFLQDPFCPGEGAERMYRTGDLGFWDEDGNVHVCGRKDRQIKMRGFRVNLDDIATVACQQMDGIRKAIATQHNGAIVLWVEPESVNTEVLKRKLRGALPQHAVPKKIAAMDKLPLSKNGKLDAKGLAQASFERSCEQEQAQKLGRFEALIAKEWRLLLGLDASFKLSGSDNFAVLGGHSLLQLTLAARLKRLCKIPMTIKDVIQTSSLADLASIVEMRYRECTVYAEALKLPQSRPLGLTKLSPTEVDWWHRYENSQSQAAFNVPFVAKLEPEVDSNLLIDALSTAIHRHRILRSRFIALGSTVERFISDEPIEVQMVESIDASTFINRPFDLSRDELVRVSVSPTMLAISISHIVCDLTALQTLLAEAATLYNGGALEPVQREYFDVTAWEQPVEPESAFHWSSALDGLSLRRDDDGRAKKSYRGTSLVREVPKELYDKLLTLTSAHGFTLHQFGLAVTGMVLHVLCQRDDVVLGCPFVNRSCDEDQKVVGLFLEALPVRVRAEGAGLTSTDVLRNVRCASQTSLANAMPWPQLLEHFGLPFPSDRQQVFDCVVTFHDDRTAQSLFPVAGVEPLPVWTEGSKFGALFEWHAFPDQLTVRLEYDTDHLSHGLVQIIHHLLLDCFEQLLDQECRHEDLRRRLTALLHQQCRASGLHVEDVHQLAKRFLQGA